jgi:hypothetical protein
MNYIKRALICCTEDQRLREFVRNVLEDSDKEDVTGVAQMNVRVIVSA